MTVNKGLGALVVTAALALSACNGNGPSTSTGQDGTTSRTASPSAGSSTRPSGTAAPVAGTDGSRCPSSAVYEPRSSGIPEVEGVGNGVSLWALLFLSIDAPSGRVIRPNSETKIVWRMTGTGDLDIRATGPKGVTVTPVWGPEGHSGSTWDRPGDEWGTGWRFPAAGCWTVRATRDGGAGATLTLRVAP